MEPYRIRIPTEIYFGRNIWKEAIREQESLLRGNILIVTTGRSLLRLGYLEELSGQLKECRGVKKVVVFDGISANPKLSEVQAGIGLGRQEAADVIVGFGGGSAMDAAKAVALGIRAQKGIKDIFYQGYGPDTEALPVIAMPTTAGTGSELSRAAILTDDACRVKNGIRGKELYPKAAIIDSVFTESVPFQVTMETGFDVLAHAVESYVSRAASPFTEVQSETAVRIVGEFLPRLAESLSDVEARKKMSFASMLMGVNLGNASTCLPHRLQYPAGACTDISHGAGLAALYTAWIQCEYEYEPEKTERILGLLTGRDVRGKADSVETVHRFVKSLRLPASLQEMGIERQQLPVLAGYVSGNIGNDPASQEEGIILKLYEMAWQEGCVCRQL